MTMLFIQPIVAFDITFTIDGVTFGNIKAASPFSIIVTVDLIVTTDNFSVGMSKRDGLMYLKTVSNDTTY